ncbi:MAG: spondin domain-containing protein, partial [Saprospiraceae bacterium]
MMTPHYYSVGKKERQFSFLPFLQNKKIYWLFSLFLFNLNLIQAQVVISEVFEEGAFELRNTGTETIDISSYWICNRPAYVALSTLTIECGSLFLAGGEEVVLSTTILNGTDAELGLYLSNNGGFSQASEIIAYVEWGTAGGGRSELATGKGIWDGNAVANLASGTSIKLTGNGTMAADWTTDTNPQKCAVAPPPASTSAARYQVTFNAAWSATTHPTDFPSSAHFSGLIGLTHTDNTALFELGSTASQGIINMAETGSKNPLTAEIQTIIAGGQGQNLVSGGGIGVSPGSVSTEFAIENSHPLVSITTMIAPSPDWFVGIRDLNLFENGDWVNSKTVEVANYDAGSDSGTSFASANQTTSPLGTITMITDGPLLVNGAIPSMGTMTFTRIDAGACAAAGGTLTGGPYTFCVDGV